MYFKALKKYMDNKKNDKYETHCISCTEISTNFNTHFL